MAIKAIAMHFGSVESLTTSCLVFSVQSSVRPKTPAIALNSLVEFLYQKWVISCSPELPNKSQKDCCKKSSGNFCSICGMKLNSKEENSFCYESLWNSWDSFLHEIFKSDCDGYGNMDDIPNPFQWEPGFVPVTKNKLIYIAENADHVLSLALEKLHPELGETTLDIFEDAGRRYKNIMENKLDQCDDDD